MSKKLVEFLRGVFIMASPFEQQARFSALATECQQSKTLPTPEEIEQLLMKVAAGDHLFCCDLRGKELAFFIRSTWMKISQAIFSGKPIVEIGLGRGYFSILAALYGADVIAIEDPAYSDYNDSFFTAKSAEAGDGLPGSFKMHYMVEGVHHSANKDRKSLLRHVLHEGDPGSICMQALGARLRCELSSAFSNKTAIKVIQALEALLPHAKAWSDTLVLCLMPPRKNYGMGYFLNRLLDQGVDLLCWCENRGMLLDSTPIWPGVNLPASQWLLAVDPVRTLSAEQKEITNFVSPTDPKPSQTVMARVLAIMGQQAYWGFWGTDLNGLAALRDSLGLVATTENFGYLWETPASFCLEPPSLRQEYLKSLTAGPGIAAHAGGGGGTKPSIFAVGARVRVSGLTSDKGQRLNGREGEVIGPDAEASGRLGVRLFAKNPGGKRPRRSFKPANLSVVSSS